MIEIATKKDIHSLENLVNSAYRGEGSKQGWTTEADLLEGELRTDTDNLGLMMSDRNSVFLKFTNNNSVHGCVYLQKQGKKLYLGMLSVSPAAQAGGIGKQLLAASEKYALEHDCISIIMNVISVRHELINWYVKHGYKKTGETKPFPTDNKFGTPRMPLEFIVLEKELQP